MHFYHITHARKTLRETYNSFTYKKSLRKFFLSDYYQLNKSKSNYGIVLNYVLNVIHSSAEGFCSMSRDTISLNTGLPEKTVEYNVQKMIKLGILVYHTFPNIRNPKQNCKLLMFNTKVNAAKIGKVLEKPKKISEKSNCPKFLFTEKQISDGLLSRLHLSSFHSLSPCFQAISLLLGKHVHKFDVLPSRNKKLKLTKYGVNYEELDITGKVLYLVNHFEEDKKNGVQIKVPEGYVFVDCDSKEAFDKLLMENYHGGFIVKSPRGGKILKKLDNIFDLDFKIKDVEFHLAGRNDSILGSGYQIMSHLECSDFRLTEFENFERMRVVEGMAFENIPKIEGKVMVGFRNNYLFRMGRKFRKAGVLNYDGMYNALMRVNKEHLSIPMFGHEIIYMAKHCLKYKDRVGYEIFS